MSSILFLSNDFLEIWMWMNYVNDTRNVEVVRALKNKNSHVFYILNVWKICFREKGKTFWTKKKQQNGTKFLKIDGNLKYYLVNELDLSIRYTLITKLAHRFSMMKCFRHEIFHFYILLSVQAIRNDNVENKLHHACVFLHFGSSPNLNDFPPKKMWNKLRETKYIMSSSISK